VVKPSSAVLDRLRTGLLRDPRPWLEPLRARGVRLVHAHFAPDAAYALPLARALGVPLIVTLHGFDVTRADASLLASGRAPLIWSVLVRRALQREAAAFVAVSQSIANRALERGFPADRLHVLPIGVDLAALTPGDEHDPGLIVLAGRLVEKKGVGIALQALAILVQRGLDVRLRIIGDGPLRRPLETQARTLGVSHRATFTGALPHAATLAEIRRAAVVIVPSLRARDGDEEGLPTVLVEALACGVPVVASDSGGAREAVSDGAEGFLVPPGDAAALAARIKQVLTTPDLRPRLSTQARRTAETRFDLARQTAALETLYDAVAARGARP
jgi:glycosyltransferase involved in cell wall biosynthesis